MRVQPAGWNSNSDVEHLGPRAVSSGGGGVMERKKVQRARLPLEQLVPSLHLSLAWPPSALGSGDQETVSEPCVPSLGFSIPIGHMTG